MERRKRGRARKRKSEWQRKRDGEKMEGSRKMRESGGSGEQQTREIIKKGRRG